MRYTISLLWIIIFFITIYIFPTTINGRFVELGVSGSKYNVLLQINTNTGTDDLGGTTIVFGFDTSSIKYTSSPIRNTDYVFHKFSGGNYSLATLTRPAINRIWVNINLPLVNNNDGTVIASSPQWTDVVTIKFDIVDLNKPKGLIWFQTSPFWGIYDADNITLWGTGVFEGNFGLSVDIKNDWNLVSVPGVNPDGQGINNWWSGRDHNTSVFRIIGGQFLPITITNPGEGYWMNNNGDNVYNTGDEWPAEGIQRVPNNPVNVLAGWNTIGGYEKIVQTNQITTIPPGLISGLFYSYSNQYQVVTALEPGHGYIVKLNGQGQINFSNGLMKENGTQTEYFKNYWGKLIFSDNSHRTFILYLVNEDIDFNFYELPPIPPDGLFDIRFSSERVVEKISNDVKAILMSGINYPVKIKAENINIKLQDESGRIINLELKSGDEITITNQSINKLLLTSDGITVQKDYLLMQNYPNPFNPITTIKFSLAKDSNVEIKIYNVLGEVVSILVNEPLTTGYHEFNFNASDLASGVYIYRIKAGDFVSSKKMILMK